MSRARRLRLVWAAMLPVLARHVGEKTPAHQAALQAAITGHPRDDKAAKYQFKMALAAMPDDAAFAADISEATSRMEALGKHEQRRVLAEGIDPDAGMERVINAVARP